MTKSPIFREAIRDYAKGKGEEFDRLNKVQQSRALLHNSRIEVDLCSVS
jgi:hypothetical protein